MSILDKPKTITDMLATVAAENPAHVELDERTARGIEMAHDYLVDNLKRIVARATETLDGLTSEKGEDAVNAAARLSESAGASGPIGSEYEKAVKHATQLVTLIGTCYGRGA